jgi:uncharacterized protein (DUF2236 family)
MNAYDRYRRPLRADEKDRYLAEQALIGRMGGADWVPETVAELDDYVERMRPRLGFTEETRSFLDFVAGRAEGFQVGRSERLDRWAGIRGSMDLMPEWAARLTGTHAPELLQRVWLRPTARWKAALVRWVYPELPCKRLALARAAGGAEPARAVAAA